MRIGELIERTGVTRATVHHYVREGLLPPPVKTSRTMALYAADCVDRILLIKSLQERYRRSLAEVKQLLRGADGAESLAKLRHRLEEEPQSPTELLEGAAREPMELEALLEASGFDAKELGEFEEVGLLKSVVDQAGRRVFRAADVDVALSLAELRDVGFSKDQGFMPRQAAIYVEALRDLLHQELKLFLARMPPEGEPDALVEMAERGIARVTPLLLAIRRKLIRDLLDATLGKSGV